MEEEKKEPGKSSSIPYAASSMTLQKAVDLGEYHPDFLANFPEWHTLSRHCTV